MCARTATCDLRMQSRNAVESVIDRLAALCDRLECVGERGERQALARCWLSGSRLPRGSRLPFVRARIASIREAALETHELALVAVHDDSLRHAARRADRRAIVGIGLRFAVLPHEVRLAFVS